MATKKPAKKAMNKKSMKRTKGGILIGMLLPAVQKVRGGALQDNSFDLQGLDKVKLGDGSV